MSRLPRVSVTVHKGNAGTFWYADFLLILLRQTAVYEVFCEDSSQLGVFLLLLLVLVLWVAGNHLPLPPVPETK